MTPTVPPRHRILAAVSASLLAMTLVSCGSEDTGSTDQPQVQRDQGRGSGGQGLPGASGEVVAVDGVTAQVRNQQTGQVAVSWTDSTAFTATVDGSLADIEVGDCVVARGAGDDTSAAAESVNVTETTDGSCAAAGFGGMGRGGPGGSGGPGGRAPGSSGSAPPEGAPADRPDVDGERPGPGAMVIGEVTDVGDDSLTVAAITVAGGPSAGTDAEPTTETRTVTVDADTRITTVVDADADAVDIGACLTAQGETDDVGAVTAETISISQPVEGDCGFGGFRGGARPGEGAGS